MFSDRIVTKEFIVDEVVVGMLIINIEFRFYKELNA